MNPMEAALAHSDRMHSDRPNPDRSTAEKAPDAFRTISEVAEELDLPQHVLRFWETRFSQIRPMKRSGGRRYYRPDDVDLLRGIRHLLYGEGYTIKGVQRILREQGWRAVQGLARGETLDAHEVKVAPELRIGGHAPADDRDDGDSDADAFEAASEADDEDFEADDADELDDNFAGSPQHLPPVLAPERREPVMAPVRHGAPAAPQPPAIPQRTVPPTTAPLSAPTLRVEDIRKLEASLHELTECKRLIEAAARREER